MRIRLSCELPIMVNASPEELAAVQPRLAELTNTRVHIDVARLVVAHARNSEFPTVAEIAEMVYNLKICCCTDATPRSTVLRVLTHLLSWQLAIWPCAYIRIACRLETELGRLPTQDDVRGIIAAQRAAVAGTAAAVEKTPNPVDISRYVQSHGLTGDDTCALCCNSMTDFTTEEGVARPRNIRKHYALPCGHKFHYHEQFCIQGTVSRWFEMHSQCPLCRHDYKTE